MVQITLESIKQVLDCLEQPVFASVDNTVVYANVAFQELGILTGLPLSTFYSNGIQIPLARDEDVADTTCVVAGKAYIAKTRKLSDATLVMLSLIPHDSVPQLLVHSVSNLRRSLHGMYNAAVDLNDKLQETGDMESRADSSQILRGVYQLVRMAHNVDMLQQLECGSRSLHLKRTEIVAFLDTVLSSAAGLLRETEYQIETSLPERQFYGNVDRELVELALWNLLANAVQHSTGKHIRVAAVRSRDMLQINVYSTAVGERVLETEHLFRRFEEAPEMRKAGEGIGIGISLIREIAMQHGGGLILSVQGTEVCASVSFGLRGSEQAQVHFPFPPAQTLNAGLVGLSEVLPPDTFGSWELS